MARSCDGCTKCCEGWLTGEVHGRRFAPGVPCHFMGKTGCTIYEDRPEHPCKTFECQWLVNAEIPEWMKPDMCNAIVFKTKTQDIVHWVLQEAGEKIRPEVLNWMITFCFNNNINLLYSVAGSKYRIGSTEFTSLEI